MKLKLLMLALLTISPMAFSQQKMIVFLDSKGGSESKQVQFSERSLERRTEKNVSFDERDLNVSETAIHQLNQTGTVLRTSRWLNAVVYETNLSAEQVQMQNGFVKRIHTVGEATKPVNKKLDTGSIEKSLDYGEGFAQVDQINLDCLHNMGYTGTGIYLAVIDAGFENMEGINYFDSVYLEGRVLDKYNFVADNDQVYNSSGHGTSVSSCIVGEKESPDAFAGTAVDVDLALYLTEDVSSETEIEEFYLVQALERCDSLGVDVANISLGYFFFDDSTTNHAYADLDGNTTISAMGINVAASKGIAVVTSAGNSGPSNISTPCDADSGLCIGAIDFTGTYAPFSSVGPNFDGQVKPDVVARGLDAWLVVTNGDLTTGNGTSFSSPVMAGATACLIQAHPTKSVAEIFDAIQKSASQYTTPDGFLGYGIPDLCVANDMLNANSLEQLSEYDVTVYPNPTNNDLYISISGGSILTELVVFNAVGQAVKSTKFQNQTSETAIDVNDLSNGVYTLRIVTSTGQMHKQVVISH